jgi:hypothetical protein
VEDEMHEPKPELKPGEPLVMVMGIVAVAIMTEGGAFVSGYLKSEGPLTYGSSEIDLPGYGRHPIRWTTIGEFNRIHQSVEV